MEEQERHIWKISEVNEAVRDMIENSLMPFWLQAEIGTINIQRSGHVYLTLKDSKSQLKAVFFGGAAQAMQLELKPGVSVEVFGKLTVYEVRGEYQFAIRTLRPLGVGDLQRRFDEMRAKLESEGLFAIERKMPMPALPRRIGVVTSPDGAAIRDFLQIINRRFPDLNVKIYPSPVQGEGAGKKIAQGVDFFNRHDNVDVIVVTRGGGSMEDLWPFNSETLARSIASSHIPVISAVGHEIDFTICDFVADLRAPTPSAAAELVIGRQAEIKQQIERLQKNLRQALDYAAERLRRRLDNAAGSYVFKEPIHMVRQKQQQIDELGVSISTAMDHYITARTNDLAQMQLKLAAIRPERALQEKQLQLENLSSRLRKSVTYRLEQKNAQINQVCGCLEALSPYNVLKRGYAMLTESKSGKLISSVNAVSSGMKINARVTDGDIALSVD